ncbi:MAG: BACON domain-containing protein [Bacteroidetes bacterium]|nr:BACON domain-containing protein [Bacteroidota bacterium]
MNNNLNYLKQIKGQTGITICATIFFCCIGNLYVFSQNVIAPGTTFKVASGTTVMSAENLVVKDGALLSNAGSLVLKKGLTNEYTVPFAIGTGTAEFSGVANQSIIGQNIIQNLTINNSTGVTIGGNTNVNGILALTSGAVTLGSNNLLLGPSATVAGIPSATAMVVATGTGELRKEFATGFTGSFTWPVGDATVTAEYSPVTLTFSAGSFGTGNYTGIKLVNSPYTGMTGSYLNRYWILSQNAVTSPLFNSLFQYLPADVVGTESQISCMKVSPVPIVTYSAANTALHQLTATGLTSVGTFTGATPTVCTLSVTPSNQNATSAAGSTTFSVTTTCAWTAASNQTWCTINTSGSGNGTITANYTANTTTSARTATITVTVSGLTPIVVTVTQAPPCTLTVTPSNQNVLAAAGSTTFSVTSSCAWTAASNQTWCTVTASGTGTGTITANYTANTTTSARTANITVTVSGVTPIVVTVTQAAPCTLSVTPSNQNVSASAGSTSFSVTSTCAWTAASNQTWCTINTSGTGNGTITANYSANTTPSVRTANITVTVSGVAPVVVTVTQSGGCTIPWQPAQNQQFNMNVIAKLYISNVLTTNPSDAIGAFVGTECRGIGFPDPALNGIIFLTITSDVQTGETVTFKASK